MLCRLDFFSLLHFGWVCASPPTQMMSLTLSLVEYLDAILRCDTSSCVRICLKISPLFQHKCSIRNKFYLTSFRWSEDTDPVMLIVVVLASIIVERLDHWRSIKIVLETSSRCLNNQHIELDTSPNSAQINPKQDLLCSSKRWFRTF